jgi:hypothetical protein
MYNDPGSCVYHGFNMMHLQSLLLFFSTRANQKLLLTHEETGTLPSVWPEKTIMDQKGGGPILKNKWPPLSADSMQPPPAEPSDSSRQGKSLNACYELLAKALVQPSSDKESLDVLVIVLNLAMRFKKEQTWQQAATELYDAISKEDKKMSVVKSWVLAACGSIDKEAMQERKCIESFQNYWRMLSHVVDVEPPEKNFKFKKKRKKKDNNDGEKQKKKKRKRQRSRFVLKRKSQHPLALALGQNVIDKRTCNSYCGMFCKIKYIAKMCVKAIRKLL